MSWLQTDSLALASGRNRNRIVDFGPGADKVGPGPLQEEWVHQTQSPLPIAPKSDLQGPEARNPSPVAKDSTTYLRISWTFLDVRNLSRAPPRGSPGFHRSFQLGSRIFSCRRLLCE